mmetsp:Transcript_3007/g.5584  ORF Transcript_3007/g.5584 Transcript_3007/m.5584 type:complete len:397 (+) Transcript_3007:163-1353(+)
MVNNRKPSMWTTGLFLYEALTTFTHQAYSRVSLSFSPDSIPKSLDGNVYLVTGANSGIGKATAKALLERGSTVHMACRSLEKGLIAKEDLLKQTGAGDSKCVLHIVDLSKIGQVKAFGSSFCNGIFGSRLDGLINNAGCMLHERKLTKEGNERNFATNSLGTYALTTSLLPALQRKIATKSDQKKETTTTTTTITTSRQNPSRVVTVSSGGAYTQKLDSKNLQTTEGFDDGTYIYAQNKRQQLVLTEKWGQIFAESNQQQQQRPLVFQSMHPGWVDTPVLKSSMPDFYNRFKQKLRTPDEGADTILWLATSDEALKSPPGSFFLDRKPQKKFLYGSFTTHTDQQADELYKSVSEICGECMPDESDRNAYGYMTSQQDYQQHAIRQQQEAAHHQLSS